MLTFLFWNLAKQPLQESVGRLVRKHDVDILALAECKISARDLLIELNRDILGTGMYFPVSSNRCQRIRLYSRFDHRCWQAVRESPYLTLQALQLPLREEILFGAVHLPSKLYRSPESQTFDSAPFASLVAEAEQACGHDRTVLVGDFNMNPFEPGMLGAGGFHGLMTQDLANRRQRTVYGNSYKTFYNPMWGFLGDWFSGPAGTCYYESSQQVSTFWSTFDQVLIRPDLLRHLERDSIEIATHDGERSLVASSGLPTKSHASDHFPIVFQLNL